MMKKILCSVLILCLLLSACSLAERDSGSARKQDLTCLTPEEVITELSSTAYGGRAVGSAGNTAAADYIAGIFKALGLKPLFEDYLHTYDELIGYPERADAQLALISADGTRTELTAGRDFYFNLPFSDLDVTLPVSQDAAACDAGKAVFYAEDYLDAVTFVREGTGRLAVSCGELKSRSNLMGLNHDDRGIYVELSEQYRELVRAEGIQLELSIRASGERGTANNVAAVLRGSEGKNALLIGAHFDGSGLCGDTLFPSAYDNASGTATMLEIVRLLCSAGAILKNDVIFVAFNGEETGRDGSKAFASAITELYEQINFINIDCVGNRDDADLGIYGEDGRDTPLQAALLSCFGEKAAAAADYPGDQRSFESYPNVSSVVVGGLDIAEGNSLIHTTADTPDRVDGDAIVAIASAITEFIKADTVYAQSSRTTAASEVDDGLTDEGRALRDRLQLDGTMSKYGQVYICAKTEHGHSLGITGCNRLLRSAEELSEACPSTILPEEITGYQFIAAQIGTNLHEADYWYALNLTDTYEVGKVYDFSGQLKAHHVCVLYRSNTGEGMILYLNSSSIEQEGREQGATLNPLLEKYELDHVVVPEHGIDGYRGFYYCDKRGVRVIGLFVDASEAESPASGLEDFDALYTLPNRFLTPAELTELLTSYDFSQLTEMVESMK